MVEIHLANALGQVAFLHFAGDKAHFSVITGATDGIGKALAVAYARNFNIVLVGRSDAKLKDALAEISNP